jgi:ABC-2 type transport system ATP-binding protein
MITVSGLTRQYGKRLAVDDMTFDVAAGRVTGFVGPSGAGKSTTMRMMVGLTRPDSGEVSYHGVHYRDLKWRPGPSAVSWIPACIPAARL